MNIKINLLVNYRKVQKSSESQDKKNRFQDDNEFVDCKYKHDQMIQFMWF